MPPTLAQNKPVPSVYYPGMRNVVTSLLCDAVPPVLDSDALIRLETLEEVATSDAVYIATTSALQYFLRNHADLTPQETVGVLLNLIFSTTVVHELDIEDVIVMLRNAYTVCQEVEYAEDDADG